MLGRDLDFTGSKRFQVQRRVGAGGMGIVYRVLDRERGSSVALKLLRNVDENSLYRFKNEFRALADLRHPNLVRLHELFFEDGKWFFTMDFVEGTPFLSYIWAQKEPELAHAASEADTWVGPARPPRAVRPPLDEARLRRCFLGLARGVYALHRVDKVHRDIKPSNVLVDQDGRVVLLDFGLVTTLKSGRQQTDVQAIGTAAYMAPEQAASQPLGPAADWYSVGVVLYEAMTGRHPFEGDAFDVLLEKQRREADPPRTLAPDVPADLDALCAHLLRRDPASRPQPEQVLRLLGGEGLPLATIESSSPLQAVPFVGRAEELATLARAFADSRAGQSVVMLVQGESGVGKSALVHQFADGLAARMPELLLLSGRCYERESLPYKACDGIVDNLSNHLVRLEQGLAGHLLPDDATLLARMFPVLRRVPAVCQVMEPHHHLPDPLELRGRAFVALRRLLTRIAARWPVLLFIDDLQWADADSLTLLADIMHPPEAPLAMLVATVRTGGDATAVGSHRADDPPALAALVQALGGVRRLALGPLSPGESREFVDMLLHLGTGVRDGGATARAAEIANEARGHPLFIQELARYFTLAAGDAPTQVRLDEALWARISQLESPARRLLELVAVAGAPIQTNVLARAADMAPPDATPWIQALREEQLVRSTGIRHSDRVEPYHDRIREAVLGRIDPALQREHHGRLAEALEVSGLADQDPQMLVGHLEAAGYAGRAALHAERAARTAAETFAFDRAAELLGTALRLGRYDEGETRALRIRTGDALVGAGRGAEAAAMYLEAAAGADAMTRLECQRRAAEHLLAAGHIERGQQALAAVLAEVGVALPSSPLRALLSILWRRALLRLRGLRWRTREQGAIPPRSLLRVDIYKAVAVGLGMVDTLRGTDFQVRALLAALRTGDRARIARHIALEAIFLATQGGRATRRAAKLLAKAEAIARECDDPWLLAMTTTSAGIVAFFSGRYRDALAVLPEGERIFRQANGMAWELTNTRLFRLFTLRNMGVFGELRTLLDDYLRDAVRRDDRYADTTMSRNCSILWLVAGQPVQARQDLERRSWSPPEGGYHLQHWNELRVRIELDLYEGAAASTPAERAARFRPLERSLLMRVVTVRTESNWMRARLALAEASVTEGERARVALAEAARLSKRLLAESAPYAKIWGGLVRAAVRLRKSTAEAAAELRAAISAADQSEMRFCAAAARWRLAQLLPPGPERDENEAAARRWLEAERVQAPARLIEVVAPGFVMQNAPPAGNESFHNAGR